MSARNNLSFVEKAEQGLLLGFWAGAAVSRRLRSLQLLIYLLLPHLFCVLLEELLVLVAEQAACEWSLLALAGHVLPPPCARVG